MIQQSHRALAIKPADTVVFTAMSKKYFYMRYFVVQFVLEQDAVPITHLPVLTTFCSTW